MTFRITRDYLPKGFESVFLFQFRAQKALFSVGDAPSCTKERFPCHYLSLKPGPLHALAETDFRFAIEPVDELARQMVHTHTGRSIR
jgi:hypothetical protein